MFLDKDTALVVLSGGQDSTTCLFWAKTQFKTVHALTLDYGQRHRAELTAAYRVGLLAGVASHEFVTVGPILAGTSPLTNSSETLEQYKDHYSLPGGLEKTFVPGRNILFLSIAANRAYCLNAASLITGICEEDSGGYPDCREDFRIGMQTALRNGLEAPNLRIVAPLMFLTKAQTVNMAWKMDTNKDCWHSLAFTHTAYDGAYPPVGFDHATLLRAKGFEEAGKPDPLVLRAVREGLMKMPTTANYKWTQEGDYIQSKIDDAMRLFERSEGGPLAQ